MRTGRTGKIHGSLEKGSPELNIGRKVNQIIAYNNTKNREKRQPLDLGI